MLFKADNKGKVSELAEYININVNTSFATMTKYIRRAELKYIVPLIGQPFYDEFEASYQANTITGNGLKLLTLVQDCLANYVYYLSIDDLSVKVSDIGVVLELSEEVQHVDDQKIFLLKKQAAQTADELAESVLRFLELNANDFPTWENSPAYTESKELFINNASEYTKLVAIIGDSRQIYLRLRPTLIDVEEIQIKDLLSPAFFEVLKTANAEGSLTENEQIVWAKVQKIVAYLTIAQEIPLLQAVFSENNTLIIPSFGYFSKRERELKLEEMRQIAYQYQQKAEPFITQLIDYLNQNADLYPEFKNSSRYVAPVEDAETNAKYDFSNSSVFPVI